MSWEQDARATSLVAYTTSADEEGATLADGERACGLHATSESPPHYLQGWLGQRYTHPVLRNHVDFWKTVDAQGIAHFDHAPCLMEVERVMNAEHRGKCRSAVTWHCGHGCFQLSNVSINLRPGQGVLIPVIPGGKIVVRAPGEVAAVCAPCFLWVHAMLPPNARRQAQENDCHAIVTLEVEGVPCAYRTFGFSVPKGQAAPAAPEEQQRTDDIPNGQPSAPACQT